MILDRLTTSVADFTRGTGWEPKPEGLCRGEVCVPAPGALDGDTVNVKVAAERLGMPIVESSEHGVFALGPATLGSKALSTATAPDPEFVTYDGSPFRLSSLRGKKVVFVAWASY
jgi:hypothetical protein